MTDRRAPIIFDAPAPRVFSIEPQLNFLEELAKAIVDASAGGASIADVEVFLPTRRAARALSDVFLKVAGAATFTPNIRAIGDVDEEDFGLFKGVAEDELTLPPAVSDIERRIALARLVAAKDRAPDGGANGARALAAADELALLIDAFYTEEVDRKSVV